MRYFGNVSLGPVHDAMRAGLISQIVTPAEGRHPIPGVEWCADNSVFGGKYPGDEAYLSWLTSHRWAASHCRFVVAPDVVADAAATLARSLPLLGKIRALGYPVAYVLQDGADIYSLPWGQFDVLFIGGSTEYKLGPEAAYLARCAQSIGLLVHMGRVNSKKRLEYAKSIGCTSVDGTFLTYGPRKNLRRLLGWLGHEMEIIE